MDKVNSITKISQVTPEVTLFLRNLGFSDYYIINIFNIVGDAAIGITQDNPYWLLEEFSHFTFPKADELARKLAISRHDSRRIMAAVEYVLRGYIGEGHTFAPCDEFYERVVEILDLTREEVEDVVINMAYDGSIQLSNIDGIEVIYSYNFFKAECGVASKLTALAGALDKLKPVGVNLDALILQNNAKTGISLSEAQTLAVKNSLSLGVSIITGGPGTGKTTIINTLISILEGSGQKVAVAAPTGRAAKRIMETSKHFASTIHRLLEYGFDEESGFMRFGRNRANPLDVDAIIVDEASMMDMMLTGALCDAMTEGTRLIIVGDSDQLPSVGAGNVLADLIKSECFNVYALKEIYRQSDESQIVSNAHKINQGCYPQYSGDFVHIAASKQSTIAEKIAQEAAKFSACNVQIITPTKKGKLGTECMNECLQNLFNPAEPAKDELSFGKKIFRIGDRVMQIKNDYKIEYRIGTKTGKGVFNGEIGIVKAIDVQMRAVTVLYDDERWVEYEYTQLENIDLAYAITVHKSQGSEFPVVIMPMTWFPQFLATRSLLYTAVTRGKEKVIIVGDSSYLNKMVDNNEARIRNSGLCSRIEGLREFSDW